MKYVPGPAFGQFSGSQGNTVASHNRFGSYLRNRTIPVNPNTPSQTSARVAFTAFSQQWRDITIGQRTGWETLAENDPIIDRQGQEVVLTGIAYYCRFNMTRRSVALARLDTAPAAIQNPPQVQSATVAISGGVPSIGYTPTVVDGSASNFQLLMATAHKSPGVTFFGRSDFRVIGAIAGDDPVAPPEDLTALYTAVFTDAWETQIGLNIAFRFTGVSNDGFIGDFLQLLAEIAA